MATIAAATTTTTTTTTTSKKSKQLLAMGIIVICTTTANIAQDATVVVNAFSTNNNHISNRRRIDATATTKQSIAIRSRNTALFSNNSPEEDVAESESAEETIMKSKSASSSSLCMDEEQHQDIPKFGDVVSLKKPSATADNTAPDSSKAFFATPQETPSSSSSDQDTLAQRRQRNITVAIASVALAILNYFWQWTHPVTPIQLLVSMERRSTPISEIGNNHKPTVMDFWAPWCENCKYMAPTLYQVEEQYRDKVNFVMVNGDDPNNWGLIEKLGVDAIPHMAMIEADGTVDTALIGPVPKQWLTQDLDVMIENANNNRDESKLTNVCKEEEPGQQADGTVVSSSVVCAETDVSNKKPLPFQMLDVFANRPNERQMQGAKLVKDDSR